MIEGKERRKGGKEERFGVARAEGFVLNRSARVSLYFLIIFLETVYPFPIVTRTT